VDVVLSHLSNPVLPGEMCGVESYQHGYKHISVVHTMLKLTGHKWG